MDEREKGGEGRGGGCLNIDMHAPLSEKRRYPYFTRTNNIRVLFSLPHAWQTEKKITISKAALN